MAQVYPFRALRYNPSLVRLEDVVTQPYDKITPAMQQAYYQRSPYNLVRIILGLPELFDSAADGDVYTRAARDFTAWRRAGILTQESEPCVFAYSQRFTVPGTNAPIHERRGFIALGELYDYSQKVVFRHEQTLSKPKSDRLNLLRATRAHFGQIFMLYSDPGLSAERLLFNSTAAPDIEVTDEYEVLHRVWRVSDPNTIKLLTTALRDKKLIIADGHHRYETALNYARERAPEGTSAHPKRNSYLLPQPPNPEAAVMMTFINMDAEGLVILPTHRVVHGLKGFVPSDFIEHAGKYFELEPLSAEDPAVLTARLASEQGRTAFVAVTAQGRHLLRTKPGAAAEALGEVSERQRQLDVVQLHALVLERLLGITPEAIREQTHVRYLRDAGEAVEQVAKGDANAAFLMNPVSLDQLREVAFAGAVLPQKSTDFFPKLLSGLAIYALD
ncbi:MAG: DUF1015 domain-containing protein [Silvibacterium sp.]|nr:DUF1015 domain-containing protein [Silvibacterium sp.]MBV8438168.1 DUF1015 domain-containing protein [Silvibacterium sp.]